MPYCKYCGKKLEEGEVCGCRGSLPKQESPDTEEYFTFKIDSKKIKDEREKEFTAAPGGAYERHMPVVDQCIVPTEEEIPVRQYDMAILRTIFPYKRAEGRLQVTNKRVIFRATGKSWLGTHFLENEFALSEIGGIELKKDRRVNFWFVFFGLLILEAMMVPMGTFFKVQLSDGHTILVCVLSVLFGLGGIALAVLKKKLFWLKMGLFGIAGIGFYLCYTSEYYDPNRFYLVMGVINFIVTIVFLILYAITEDLIIKIKVTGAANVMEIRRMKKGFFFTEKEEYTGFSEVLPWKDTEIAARELGALINDVKLYGDAGIAKWK